MNLQTFCGADVIPRTSAEDAIELLYILPSIPLIITREKIGSEETANQIYDFIHGEKRQIDMIVFGSFSRDPNVFAVADENNWNQAVERAVKILGVSKETLEQRAVPDYVPVPIDHFLNLQSTCCDVFIRIKKAPGEFQFIKRIHAMDHFNRDLIQKYANQGLKDFYIPKERWRTSPTLCPISSSKKWKILLRFNPSRPKLKCSVKLFKLLPKKSSDSDSRRRRFSSLRA